MCKNTQGNTAAGGAVARRKSCPHREIPAIPGRSGRTQLPIGPEGPRNDLGGTRLNSSERSGQRGGCSSPQRRVVHPTSPLRVWDLCPRQRRVVRGVNPGIRLRVVVVVVGGSRTSQQRCESRWLSLQKPKCGISHPPNDTTNENSFLRRELDLLGSFYLRCAVILYIL